MNADPVRLAQSTKAHMVERYDGFVVVAFVAGTNKAVMMRHCEDDKTKLALHELLSVVLDADMPAQEDNGNGSIPGS